MKKILIVCGSGVTSYLLAEELNHMLISDYYVYNANVSFTLKDYHYFHLVIVAPQVSFMYEKINQLCKEAHIPCIKLDFDEYESQSIREKIINELSSYEDKKLNICLVKSDHSGYLAQLYVNKMKKSLQNQRCDAEICIMKYSQFQEDCCNYDYVLFEPQLMYQYEKKDRHLLIRSSDFHSLNVDALVDEIIK